MAKLGILVCVLLQGATWIPVQLHAQELPFELNFPLEGVRRYRDTIPKPESVLGHRVGERHTYPHQIAQYFRAVEQASERVQLVVYGRSHQLQPLLYAIVTSPENQQRLPELRQQNLLLSDAPGDVSDDRLRDHVAVAYQGYGVHGDEASGPEAAMLLLYHLAAGEGPCLGGWGEFFQGRQPVASTQGLVDIKP